LQNKEFPPYSVLMSVYEKESPEFLKKSVESIFSQSIVPDEFVLVIDGKIGPELENEINSLKDRFKINCAALAQNLGLGRALNFGLSHCKNEIVMRMDSDDISVSDRAEKQLALMQQTGADIVSSAVAEFESDPECITSVRTVPQTHEEIMRFVKKRTPFNHPAVLYKKSVIESVGGYMDYLFFEDYELFARALANGAKGANSAEPLVLMRTGSGLIKRRGGREYVKCLNRFYNRMRELGICSFKETVTVQLPRAVVALLPQGIRKFVYQKFLRG